MESSPAIAIPAFAGPINDFMPDQRLFKLEDGTVQIKPKAKCIPAAKLPAREPFMCPVPGLGRGKIKWRKLHCAPESSKNRRRLPCNPSSSPAEACDYVAIGRGSNHSKPRRLLTSDRTTTAVAVTVTFDGRAGLITAPICIIWAWQRSELRVHPAQPRLEG